MRIRVAFAAPDHFNAGGHLLSGEGDLSPFGGFCNQFEQFGFDLFSFFFFHESNLLCFFILGDMPGRILYAARERSFLSC
jgi:hypothetical protein